MVRQDYGEIEAIKARQIKTGSRVTVRIDDDEVLYRGRVIRRHNDVPNGYGGRFSVSAKRQDGRVLRESFSHVRDAKAFIDAEITKTQENDK